MLPVSADLPLTLRAGLAGVLSFALAMLLAPRCIRWLRARYREPRFTATAALAKLHDAKQGTPTMGGVFLVVGFMLVALLFCELPNPLVMLLLLTATALCAVGCVDDWVKLRTARRGLSPRAKLAAQAAIALMAATRLYTMHMHIEGGTKLCLPLVGSFDMGAWFVPWAVLVIVGASNAVNLTDGLDGLAGGCLVWAVGAMSLVAVAAGDARLAAMMGITPIAGAGELAVVGAALGGGLLAFLWFNCHPAAVFMGDAGSLPLGGVLGLIAVIARQELLLLVVGGVFVVEAISVIVQVGWFRWTRRRVFLCAPLHHHFQLRGWAEDKIVVRFWIAGGMCAVLGLAIVAAGASLPGETGSHDASPRVAGRQALPAETISTKQPSQELPALAELIR